VLAALAYLTNSGQLSSRDIPATFAEVVDDGQGEVYLRVPVRINRTIFPDGIPQSLTLRADLNEKLNSDWYIADARYYLLGDAPGDVELLDKISISGPVGRHSKQYHLEADVWDLAPDADYVFELRLMRRDTSVDVQTAVDEIEGGAITVGAKWR
jgi:hypothetical protein